MSLIRVVKGLGEQKNYGIEFTEDATKNSVARLMSPKGDEVVGFITMGETANKKVNIDPQIHDLEPLIPMSMKSFVILISGERDSGKSTMGAMFINQYASMYPNNPLFLISQKDKSIDRNLSQIQDLNQLNDDDIMTFDINDYANSLIVVDDSDFGKHSKAVFEILNSVSTVGREYNISLIFITHFNSRLNMSRVYSEFQIYITFPNNLDNNRMLFQNLGLNSRKVESLKELKGSFYIFNRIYRCLLTDKVAIKF